MKYDIINNLKKIIGNTGFYVENFITGESLKHNDTAVIQAASVIKLMIMGETFRQMINGKADPKERFLIKQEDFLPSCGALSYMEPGISVTLMDLCILMIILSDNTASNMLIRRLGMENINQFIDSLGYRATRLNRLLFDQKASAEGLENTISAGEIGDFFTRLYRGEILSEKASAMMLKILKNQRLNGKIPFFLHTLSPAPEIAHKTGEDTGITHDVGIIYGKQPFVLCCCGDSLESVPLYERFMQDCALSLYERYNGKGV